MLDKIVDSIYNKYNTSKRLDESLGLSESLDDIESELLDIGWQLEFAFADSLQEIDPNLSINDIIKKAFEMGLKVYKSPMGWYGIGDNNYVICKSLEDVINAHKAWSRYPEEYGLDDETIKIMTNPKSFTPVNIDLFDALPNNYSFFLNDDEIMNKDKSGKEIFIGYLNDGGSIELNSGIDLSSKDEEALLSYIQDNYNENAYIA